MPAAEQRDHQPGDGGVLPDDGLGDLGAQRVQRGRGRRRRGSAARARGGLGRRCSVTGGVPLSPACRAPRRAHQRGRRRPARRRTGVAAPRRWPATRACGDRGDQRVGPGARAAARAGAAQPGPGRGAQRLGGRPAGPGAPVEPGPALRRSRRRGRRPAAARRPPARAAGPATARAAAPPTATCTSAHRTPAGTSSPSDLPRRPARPWSGAATPAGRCGPSRPSVRAALPSSASWSLVRGVAAPSTATAWSPSSTTSRRPPPSWHAREPVHAVGRRRAARPARRHRPARRGRRGRAQPGVRATRLRTDGASVASASPVGGHDHQVGAAAGDRGQRRARDAFRERDQHGGAGSPAAAAASAGVPGRRHRHALLGQQGGQRPAADRCGRGRVEQAAALLPRDHGDDEAGDQHEGGHQQRGPGRAPDRRCRGAGRGRAHRSARTTGWVARTRSSARATVS